MLPIYTARTADGVSGYRLPAAERTFWFRLKACISDEVLRAVAHVNDADPVSISRGRAGMGTPCERSQQSVVPHAKQTAEIPMYIQLQLLYDRWGKYLCELSSVNMEPEL